MGVEGAGVDFELEGVEEVDASFVVSSSSS
jgi:hypothetical protein